MVKCLVLDIGEILLRLDFSRLKRELGLKELFQWELYDGYERGALTEAEFLVAIEKTIGKKLAHADFLDVWNSVIVGAVPGIVPLVEKLAARLPLYALSNTNETHLRHLVEAYPWMNRFRRIFSSHELKRRKPELAIYEDVSREVGFAPGELLFIDDREENVRGARAAGFHAELCTRSPEELVEILGRYGIIQPGAPGGDG